MNYAETYGRQLQAWAAAHRGPDIAVGNVRSLGGHSAVTVGFDLIADGVVAERLVLKVPPPGARAKANFDFLRQVPLFDALAKHGALAPAARWWSEDGRWFGQPCLIMSRLRGTALPDIFGPKAVYPDRSESEGLFRQAIDALARVHAIDVAADLTAWSSPRPLGQEVDHWLPVLRKSSNRGWVHQGERLHAALSGSMPTSFATGLVHGDFYSNNWLFDDGTLTGIVDWESTTVGAILLDLGWVCMMYDAASWGPMRHANMGWHPGPDCLLAAYASLSATDLSELSWFRALAGYRLACNTAYYYELHQTGRRPNPAWDVLGESFPFMLSRAFELLA